MAGRGYRFRGALEWDATERCLLAVGADGLETAEFEEFVGHVVALWRGERLEHPSSPAIMAGFSSADDAVSCAVSLLERARANRCALQLRVGLSLGDAAPSRTEALRLCNAAARDEALAPAALVAALTSRDGLVLRDHEPDARPAAAPLPVVSLRAGDLPPAALLGHPPFVGRKAELARLTARLEEARTSRGGLVLLSGEAGIGKTRLVEEFSARARRTGAVVLAGLCTEAGAPSYQPFADALEEYARGTKSRELRQTLDLDSAGMLTTITAIAKQRPLVLAIEDLHWADPATLTLLSQLARAALRSPLLLIGSYRDVGVSASHPLARLVEGEEVRESIALAGLDAGQLHLWLEALAPGRSSEATATAVYRVTGGNPLLVRELLLEEGLPGLRRLLAAELPVWPTPLVGRDRERQDVVELFAEERLVTLTGAGGCGKTRLACAAAEDLLDRFADGVAWVELARLAAREQLAGAVLAACGAHEAPGASALDLLVRQLASSERLLVLDNCEHLLGACAELADALRRAAPGVRILATSREPLGVAGEVIWRVPSLSLPDPEEHDLRRIAESDAVSLFRSRARAARAEFRLDAPGAPLVARVCRRLDGIPLALELAAAQVRSLSLQSLADGLDDRFRLLTAGSSAALPRQRTLLASVEWSHDLLDELERVLFRRLSVFAAPFEIEATEAVAADEELDALSVFEGLASLVDKSLVQPEGDRFRLLETMRHYALERAKDAGELDELRDRHLAWFERRARSWELDREIATSDQLEEIAAEAPDLTAAAEWCAAHGHSPTSLLHALRDHWSALSSFQEARTASARILGSLRAGSREHLEATAALAVLLFSAGEYGWLGSAREALARADTELDPALRGFLEIATSLPELHLGRSEAIAALRRAAASGEILGNRKLETFAKDQLAWMFSLTGDLVGARALLESLGHDTSNGSRYVRLSDRSQLQIATLSGDLAGARRIVEEGLARDPGWNFLGSGATVGFYSADAELLRRVVSRVGHFTAVGGAFGGVPLMMEGYLLLVTGEVEAAERTLARAGEHFQYGSSALRVSTLRGLARLSLGDTAGAEALLADSEARLEGSELHHARAGTLLLSAQIDRVRGERLAAESKTHAALASATEFGMWLVATDALEVLALLAGDRGDLGEAACLYSAANAFRERSGYRWQPQHQRCALDALRPKLAEQALAEGTALSLAEAAAYAQRGRAARVASLAPGAR